jgi:hypothetical protein
VKRRDFFGTILAGMFAAPAAADPRWSDTSLLKPFFVYPYPPVFHDTAFAFIIPAQKEFRFSLDPDPWQWDVDA